MTIATRISSGTFVSCDVGSRPQHGPPLLPQPVLSGGAEVGRLGETIGIVCSRVPTRRSTRLRQILTYRADNGRNHTNIVSVECAYGLRIESEPPSVTKRSGDGCALFLLSPFGHDFNCLFTYSLGAHSNYWDRPGRGQRGACNVPPSRGQQTGTRRNVRRHGLDRLNASMIKQKRNPAPALPELPF